jgi:hypothetical protein
MGPDRVLSAHLPPSHEPDRLLAALERAAGIPPFVGPDQADLEAMSAA